MQSSLWKLPNRCDNAPYYCTLNRKRAYFCLNLFWVYCVCMVGPPSGLWFAFMCWSLCVNLSTVYIGCTNGWYTCSSPSCGVKCEQQQWLVRGPVDGDSYTNFPFFWRFLKSISQMNSEHNLGFLFLFLLSLPFSLSTEGFLTLYFLFLANKVPSIMTPLARRAGKETFNIASISKSVKPWLHDYQKFAHTRSRS